MLEEGIRLEFINLLKKAQDTAAYDDKKVEDDVLSSIFEAVRFTPSIANMQPWEAYIIECPETKKMLDGCTLDPMLREKEGETRLSNAPVVVIVYMDRKRARARFGKVGEDIFALQDIAAAVNNMKLAAAEQGVSSCWIREVDMEKVAKVLKFSKMIKPVALVTLGYCDAENEMPPLLETREWVHKIGRGQ